jgi:hypothetical protein
VQLKLCPGISYATVAADAHQNGRQKLAALLLDYEPRASEQVPLLTSMGEEERALVKAIESGDTDLVYFSIFHNWRQVSGIVVSFDDLEQLLALFVFTCRYPVQGT